MAVAAFVAARSGEDRCEPDTSAFAGVWDVDGRAAIERAFSASGRPFAADTWRTVDQVLTQWTADWVDVRLDACERTARGEQS